MRYLESPKIQAAVPMAGQAKPQGFISVSAFPFLTFLDLTLRLKPLMLYLKQ